MKTHLLSLVLALVLCATGAAQADVIVGALPDLNNYTPQGGFHAYSVGTTSCNIGTVPLQWISSTNQHPVIGQQMYRVRDGIFEQIGMSWLKHGFFALQGNLCGTCSPNPNGSALGVGCSDPYGASLNGSQSSLGPRNEVNASTGVFTYPPTYGASGSGSTWARLRVPSNTVTNQPSGTRFFIEGQYVTQDDAAAGNHHNNASYRELNMTSSGNASLTGPTVQQMPAITVWPSIDANAQVINYDVPGDGRFYLGTNSIPLGGGMTRYVFALHNLNSYNAARAINIAMPAGATVNNLEFRDADYHSGEMYGSADWTGSFSGNTVTFVSPDAQGTPNGSALRWGSCHTFIFESNMLPGQVTVDHMETNGSFTFGVPPAADWQTNTLEATFSPDGMNANAFTGPMQMNMNFGQTSNVVIDSTVTTGGSVMDIFFHPGNAVAASGGGTTLLNGSIVNLNLGMPLFQLWNWAPTGNNSFAFVAPNVPVDVAAQLAVTDVTTPGGLWTSAALELDITACSAGTVPHSLGDDNSIVVSFGAGGTHECVSTVSIYGTAYTELHLNSNGSCSFGSGTGDFTASTGEFLSQMPRVAGQWSDLEPNNTGTVTSTSTAGGAVTVSFANVEEWGASATISVDMIFDTNGDVTIGNHTVGAGWGTDTIVGFSPGGNASGSSVTWSSLVGSTQSYPAGNAIYQFVNNGSPSGFTNITLHPNNSVTVN